MISRPWSFITQRVPLRYKIHYRGLYNWFRGERELRLMKHVCQKDRIALDIGANLGIFSYFLRRHSRRCMAFEPNPDMVSILRTTYGNDIDIFPFALSDVAKEIALSIPVINGVEDNGRATIEAENDLDGHKLVTREISCKRLDDLNLDPVGFIKIDVEGHEEAVLLGGATLLERDRPTALIEIEERHKSGAIDTITERMNGLGYRGFFLLNGRLRSIDQFELAVHQRPNDVGDFGIVSGATYINNFLFVHDQATEMNLATRIGIEG